MTSAMRLSNEMQARQSKRLCRGCRTGYDHLFLLGISVVALQTGVLAYVSATKQLALTVAMRRNWLQ